MKETIIASRYARGLAEYAHEKNELDSVREDIDGLADLLDPDRGDISVPELLDFLRSPTVPPQEKIKLTDVICEKMNIGKTVSDFLNVLINKNRIALTGMIARKFDQFAAEFEHIKTAQVETAKPLADTHRNMIIEALKAATGSEVRIDVKQNPDLVGGVRIKLGDTLLDGSIAGKLERIENSLS